MNRRIHVLSRRMDLTRRKNDHTIDNEMFMRHVKWRQATRFLTAHWYVPKQNGYRPYYCRRLPLFFVQGRWRGTMAELQIQPFDIPLRVWRRMTTALPPSFWSDGSPGNGTHELAGAHCTRSIEGIPLPHPYTIEDRAERNRVFPVEKKALR